jgi:hypothetical protein
MLGFKCVGGGEYLRITHVELDDTSEADQFMPYTGPVFDELDETLQQAFVDYLEERGEPGAGISGRLVGGARRGSAAASGPSGTMAARPLVIRPPPPTPPGPLSKASPPSLGPTWSSSSPTSLRWSTCPGSDGSRLSWRRAASEPARRRLGDACRRGRPGPCPPLSPCGARCRSRAPHGPCSCRSLRRIEPNCTDCGPLTGL